MALATLTFQKNYEGNFHLIADIGTNAYYTYIVGKSKGVKNGQPVVDDVSFESELFQAEPTGVFNTSFSIKIPENLSTGHMSYVQLISYKDSEHRSPAFSDVLKVGAGLLFDRAGAAEHRNSIASMTLFPLTSSRNVAFTYQKRPKAQSLIADRSRHSFIEPLTLSFSRSNKLNINFVLTDPIMVRDKPKYIYQTKSGIKLMLAINNNSQVNAAPFPRAIVQLMVKDSISLRLLLEKKFKLKDVATGTVLSLDITTAELRKLPKNKDLLISANFVWQEDPAKENVGNFSDHSIFLSDGFVLQNMGAAVSEEIPLNDVIVNRAFWHKVWEGGGNNKRWELDLDAKYLCIYKYDTNTNNRIESRLKLRSEEAGDEIRLKVAGKLKTGLEVSPLELNKLLTSSGDYPTLSLEHLAALMSDEFETQMNQEANFQIALKGKKDERGVVWVYPEITIHEVILKKIIAVNENGQVSSTADEHVFFPRISSFHFIGAKTA
jgi:hypothetical protein